MHIGEKFNIPKVVVEILGTILETPNERRKHL